MSQSTPMNSASGHWLKETLRSWVPLILMIILLKSCIVDQYTIPSGSMEPTLHGANFFKGDRVLVNKWLFGPRIPFTNIRLWNWGGPERWDIVVFTPTKGSSQHSTLIKRVVGLPGERIQISYGQIYVNGEVVPVPEEIEAPGGERMEFPPHMLGGIEYYNPEDIKGFMQRSQDVNERAYFSAVLDKYDFKYGIRPEDEYAVVPEDHYLMLGDNTLFSVDGRVFGWVPHNNLLGKAVSIWYPFNRRRDFTGWTGTLWGKGLMIGIPLFIIGWELQTARRDRRRKLLKAATVSTGTDSAKEDIPPTD